MAVEQLGKNWKADAIYSLKPGAKWCLRDDDLTWNEGNSQTEPTDEEIDAEIIRLKAVYVAQEYARERAAGYPRIGDQMDMIYKDTKNSTTTHADAVEAIKTKWPKDNSGPVE